MPDVQRLVELFAAKYRWGLHPIKVLVALLAPVAIVWLADRRLRRQAATIGEEQARIARLPRLRRR